MPAPKGNKYALGLTTNGRPPIYDSPKEMQGKIIQYFESLLVEWEEENEDGSKRKCSIAQNPTVTGLALFLGFCSRQSMYAYKEKEDFCYIVKRAIMIIENHYEDGLNYKSPTGAIFALKNMGWKDKTETDITSGGQPIAPQMELPDGKTMDEYVQRLEDAMNKTTR